MPVPDYQSMMLPMLRLIDQGKERMVDCVPLLVEEFGISPEEAQALLPSGRDTFVRNRAHWARQYSSQAGLVSAHARGRYHVTKAGATLLKANPSHINNATLKSYPSFVEFLNRAKLRVRPMLHRPLRRRAMTLRLR